MISARRKHAILGSDVPAERSRGWLLVVLVAVVSTGCAHIPLRRNTINQARTVADIHQQQVLNNLAMFVYNPYSMPCFSYPTQGTNQVVNTTTAELNGSFSPLTIGFTIGQFVLNTLGFNGSAQYQSNEAFTMVPINDPRKLELMRCAYQRVVANCCGSFPSSNCPDCQTRFNSFYTGDPDGNIRQRTAGITTSECLNGPCWFCFGPKSAVPKHQPGILVAHYADMYVWVLPAGRDGLTRLTMTILDYAMNDPPVRLTKDIVYYIDEHGLPTNQLEAVGTVSAKVAIDERPEALLNIPTREEIALEQQLKSQLDLIDSQLRTLDATKDAQQIQTLWAERKLVAGKLEFLKTEVNNRGLNNEFIPRNQTFLGPSSPGPISPNILQYQQLLNQIR